MARVTRGCDARPGRVSVAAMSDPHFFGYGSLVNRATHAYPRAAPATLRGWRRVWRQTRLRPVAFLSVAPDPGARIDGVIAEVPGADWSALDAREHAYLRRPVREIAHAKTGVADIAVYQVAPDTIAPGEGTPAILLSYLDTVVQGFLREFGEAGVAGFFETTHDWGVIQDDRANPVYPRAQALTLRERGLVDRWLADLRIEIG